MELFGKSLRLLQSSRYFRASLKDHKKLENAELLTNGQALAQLVAKQWKQVDEQGPVLHFDSPSDMQYNPLHRFSFIHTPEFLSNVQQLRQSKVIQCPSVVKFIATGRKYESLQEEDTIEVLSRNKVGLFLIADYFVHPSCGLEQFFSIQRRRKIWWMQFSANSSRYFFQPYEHSDSERTTYGNCASIMIKARFPMGTIKVEDITLLPLEEMQMETLSSYHLLDEHANEVVVPAVVRSVINLDVATCALLFDSCDHCRHDTLLLNRKLAPYQFLIAGHHNGKNELNVRDLCKHLSIEVRTAGLRTLNKGAITDSRDEVNKELLAADSFGIPYSVIVEERTLNTGLMKLRSRDTTLEETIHISDVPDYFSNIFNLNRGNKTT